MSPYTQAQWDPHFNKPFSSDIEFAKLQFKALNFESSEESYALKKREREHEDGDTTRTALQKRSRQQSNS